MIKTLITFLAVSAFITICHAQKNIVIKDSTEVRIHPSYNSVSNSHRKFFGENYRKEWSTLTKLPVLKISDILGGLRPVKTDSSHQTQALQLEDNTGEIWILRKLENHSGDLTPETLQGSMYEKWIDDHFSAQHPYSALIVPVLADAVNVPHTSPVIGIVAHDKLFGTFEKDFAGSVCLLEKREPYGDSDNTLTMLQNLAEDNRNKVDGAVFFRTRLLDLLIADWGRHENQWQWVNKPQGNGEQYLAVHHDRDQALYINQGIIPKAASKITDISFLDGFDEDYDDVNKFFINTTKLNQQLLNSYTHQQWMQMTRDFVAALPDNILLRAVDKLPASLNFRKDWIFQNLKSRRDHMAEAMDTYYRFLYRTTDIRTSDKAESIQILQQENNKVRVSIGKLSEKGNETLLFDNTFDPDITKEIRLFIGKGNDSVKIDIPDSEIKFRIVGGEGQKTYDVKASKNQVQVYENLDNDRFLDSGNHLKKYLSNDTLNTQKAFSDLYISSTGFSPTVDLRSVDGPFLGLAYTIKRPGFRKYPYASKQKISALKSLSSPAVMLQYNAEWISVFKKTDLTVDGLADMKGNILNFFGRGNDTFFDQSGDFRVFYRVNFSFYQFDPALRFRPKNNLTINVGPSFQYYSFNEDGNPERFINTETAINQTDLRTNKAHAGLFLNFNWDTRDDRRLPTRGLNFNVRMHGYEGLNNTSSSYAQIFPQISFYKSLDSRGKIILANRTGGGFTTGKTAFYQNAFLGSQDNLLGFRKFRFAGDHLLYNNLEARIAIPNFMRYVLPGKFGLIGFYDVGRVWVKNEDSNSIHHGYGGGIYLTPFNRFFIRAVAGFSNERMQPTVAVRQRF